MARTAGGKPSSGNKAPERKNNGMIKKFIIKENACMSSSNEAMVVPMAVNNTAIMIMKTIANGR